MKSVSARLMTAGAVLLAIAMMVWPAIYNRQPFFSTDTSAYIRGADAGIQQATGIPSSWTRVPAPKEVSAAPQSGAPAENASRAEDQTVLAGRSIYYGMFLYAGHVMGGFWLSVCIQGLIVAYLVSMALKACKLEGRRFLGVSVLVISLTPASLFVSYLMPDIFAAVTILCCSLLLLSFGKTRVQSTLLFSILVFALLAHSSHVLIALLMLVVGAVIWLLNSTALSRQGIAAIAGALALSFVGELVFSAGVARFTGHPPVRPPFLMARVIEDGPGYRYLQEACPRVQLVVCRFMDRLPLRANDFLWAEDQVHGVFSSSDPKTRRELSNEQYKVVLAAVLREPWVQFRASMANAIRQASMIGVPGFEYSALDRDLFVHNYPADVARRMERTAAYEGRMPIRFLTVVSYASAAAGLLYLLVALLRRKLTATGVGVVPLRWMTLVLAGVAANACICGVLSIPFDRYQARVVWLIPLVALIIDFKLRPAWWQGKRQ